VTFVQNEDPVETFIADSPNESLGIGIAPRRSPRCAQDSDSLRLEYLVEGGAEPVVAVVDRN
jgi:hypothetical protein